MSINTLSLSGRLTAEPKKAGNEDMPILNFSIAFDTFKKGEQQANFIDCTMFGQRAKNLAPFLKKGMLVFLSGKIEQQIWMKDDVRQSKIAFLVNDVAFGQNKTSEQAKEELPF